MKLHHYPGLIISTLVAVPMLFNAASSSAQVTSGDGFSVNYSGRNAVQAFISHGFQYLDGVVEVSSGEEVFFTKTYNHRATGQFTAPHPVTGDTVPLAASFFDTLLMDGLPNGQELTFTFRYEAASFLQGDALLNPESFEKSMTGTLAHVVGELRTQESDYTVTWEGGEVLLDGRLDVHKGVTLRIKDAVVKSLEPDSSLSRAEILMVGGNLNASNTLFENLDEISLSRQDEERSPLCLMENCVFRNDTFIFEVRNTDYNILWNKVKEDHSANYNVQILSEADPLPDEGTGLVALRLTGDLSSNSSTQLHVRIFDLLGNLVTDASEEELNFNPTFFKGNLRVRVNNGSHQELDEVTQRELADSAFGFAGLEYGQGLEILSRHTDTGLTFAESKLPNTTALIQSEADNQSRISNSFVAELLIGDPENDPTHHFRVSDNIVNHIQVYGSNNTIRDNIVKTRFALGLSGTGSSTGIRVGPLSSSSELQDTSENQITNNLISGFNRGIELRFANNNIFSENIVELNRINLVFHGHSAGGEEKPLSGNQIFNNIFRLPREFDTGVEVIPGVNFDADGHCAENFCDNIFVSQNPPPTGNIVDGPTFGGNFWDDSFGVDSNGDGFEDEPNLLRVIPRYEDPLPLFLNQDVSLVVNLASDESDADPNDNVADVDLETPGIQTTLRAAIEFANAADEKVEIRFDLPDEVSIEIAQDLELSGPADILGSLRKISFAEEKLFRISAGAGTSRISSLISSSGRWIISEARDVLMEDCGLVEVRVESNGAVEFLKNNNIDRLVIEDSAGCVVGNEENSNDFKSVQIIGAGSAETSITGNTIGTLLLENVPDTIIKDNLFLDTIGIELKGAGTTGTIIQGNKFACGVGVLITEESSQNLIGGTEPDQSNVFEGMSKSEAPFSDDRQVGVGVSSGDRNTVIGNKIEALFSGMLVDLDFDLANPAVPTLNDDDTSAPDGLPNRLINKPELLLYTLRGAEEGGLQLLGSLESLPNTTYTIELFTQFNEVGPRAEFNTDGNGLGVFAIPLEAISEPVTAWVTDAEGNTSEASDLLIQFIVNSPGAAGDANPNDGLNLTGNVLENGAPEATLKAAFEEIERIDEIEDNTIQILFQLEETTDILPQIILEETISLTTPRNVKIGGGLDLSPEVRTALIASGVAEQALKVNEEVEFFGNFVGDTGLDLAANHLEMEGFVFRLFKDKGLRVSVAERVEIFDCQFLQAGEIGLELVEATGDNAFQIPEGFSGERFVIRDSFFGVNKEGEEFRNRFGLSVQGVKHGRIENNVFGANFTGAQLENVSDVVLTQNRFGIFSNEAPVPNGSVTGEVRIGSGLVIQGVSKNITVGGSSSDVGNIFGANAEFGLHLMNIQAEEPIRIQGNTFGSPFPNGVAGLALKVDPESAVGPGSGMILIGGEGAAGNRFVDEPVGVILENQPDGAIALLGGNRFESGGVGVVIQGGEGHQIGGSESLPFPNIFNANDVCIQIVNGLNHIVSQNSMFGNLAGIELLEGANNAIQPPVLRSVIHDGAQLDIDLAITADQLELGTDYIIEVFKSRRIDQNSLINPRDINCDQGRTFIGSQSFTLNEAQQRFVNMTLDLPLESIGGEDNISTTVTVVNRGTSEYSNCFAFVPGDANGDGVPEALEESVTGDGDFNENGIPDINETLVTAVQSFPISGELGPVLPIAVAPQQVDTEVTIRQVKGLPIDQSPAPPPANIIFPIGLMTVELEVEQAGDTVTFSLLIPDAFEDQVNCYYKLVRQTEEGELEWICYDNAKIELDRKRVTVTLTDGQIGDLDLIANRFIRDPGGLAFDPDLEPEVDFEISVSIESRTLQITFPADSDKNYTLQHSLDLETFSAVEGIEMTEMNAETGTASFIIELPEDWTLQSEFFRVVEE